MSHPLKQKIAGRFLLSNTYFLKNPVARQALPGLIPTHYHKRIDPKIGYLLFLVPFIVLTSNIDLF
jgi:hypothetical protein